MIFTQAIVRSPGQSIISGLSESGRDVPNYQTAREQHRRYVQALEACGLSVHTLTAEENWPDSTFVEDVAVLTPHCTIITAPGAESRQREVDAITPVLDSYYSDIYRISTPGTLEGGDVMRIGSHYYIGLSNRTNEAGAKQLIAILEKYGMSGSIVAVPNLLHLKTGITQVAENTLIAVAEFATLQAFCDFSILTVDPEEQGAANCIAINGKILMSAGFPRARKLLETVNSEVIEVDISEFSKIDGGLTCLSLRR